MNPRRDRTGPHEARYLIEDLSDGLVWPLLLRGPGLALRPQRLLLGVVTVVVVGLIASIGKLWAGDEATFGEALTGDGGRAFSSLVFGALTLNTDLAMAGVAGLFALPGRLVRDYPVSVWALGVPMFAVWALFAGAIARGVACEAAGLPVPGWTRALAFALRRWVAFVLAWVVPIGVIVVSHLVLAVSGFVFLSVPVLDVVGGVLYGLGLVLGLVSVLLQVLLVLGGPMLIPAIATEGTDSIDGLQRGFGYVFGRPLRLVIYLLIACAVGAAAVGLAGALAGAVDGRTTDVMTSWTSDEANEKVDWRPEGFEADSGDGIGARTGDATHRVVGFWRSVLTLMVAGYGVSYFATAGTLVYLCARRVNDGQDVGEVWQPT